MPGYLTFLIVIAILISLEIGLRLVGSSLTIIIKLIQSLKSYSENYPKQFAGKLAATIFSILFTILGWVILFKLPNAIEGYTTFTNITFITIFSISVLLFIGAFIWDKVTKIRSEPNNEFPTDIPDGILNKLKHFFITIPAWLFKNNIGPDLMKVIIGLAIFLAIVIGFITLLVKYPSLSKGIFIALQICISFFALAIVYGMIQNNPQIKEFILDSFVFKFLYNIVFAIPCILYMFMDTSYGEIKNTPKYVYIILAVELLIIGIYIASLYSDKLLEKIYNIFFISKTDLSYAKQSAMPELIRKLSDKKAKFYSMTNDINLFSKIKNNIYGFIERATIPKSERKNIKPMETGLYLSDWDSILQQKLYLKKNESKLKNILIKEGFKSRDNKDFNPSEDKDIEKAKSYVQTNGAEILKILDEIRELEETIKQLNENVIKKDSEEEYSIEDSKILLNRPQYLDERIKIGDFNNLKTDSSLYNYKYSISAWIFLHEMPTNYRLSSTKFTPILDYASNPRISYNLEKHMFRISIKKKEGEDLPENHKIIYETDKIPMQRWNNIVINFQGSDLDIFINGMLVSTTKNIIPYMEHDVIYSGYKKGVSGGICNVTYFSSPLSRRQIQFLYNSFKNKDPPVI